MTEICKKYFDLETLHNKGDTEASDKFFMDSLDMSAIAATFYNHNKGSISLKILNILEPLQPIWISNVLHNSLYRWFKDMAVLCYKIIMYYADMAKDLLLAHQMWILAGFTLYIRGKMFDDEQEPGIQFNRNIFCWSFCLKNRLRFHFDSETCLNNPFLNVFFV